MIFAIPKSRFVYAFEPPTSGEGGVVVTAANAEAVFFVAGDLFSSGGRAYRRGFGPNGNLYIANGNNQNEYVF